MKYTNFKFWKKKGLIFNPKDNSSKWINNYAAIPVPDLLSDKKVRVFFSTRDRKGRSIPTYIDCDPQNPEKILYTHSTTILELGKLGTFDDNGIMPSCIVNHGNKKYMYYIGWNPQKTVSYRLSIGLAISEDQGESWTKYSNGPICDRGVDEPFFNTAPYVIKFSDTDWRMWYVSCTKWEIVNNWPEPFYNIKYAISKDGINWEKTDITCIDYDAFTNAIGRPCVIQEGNIFKMVYSYRNIKDYRTNPKTSYRLGYAESLDGLNWERKDKDMGIRFGIESWDSMMNEYSSYYLFNGNIYLLYNGNGFGSTGFGYAISKIYNK